MLIFAALLESARCWDTKTLTALKNLSIPGSSSTGPGARCHKSRARKIPNPPPPSTGICISDRLSKHTSNPRCRTMENPLLEFRSSSAMKTTVWGWCSSMPSQSPAFLQPEPFEDLSLKAQKPLKRLLPASTCLPIYSAAR